MKSYKAEGIIIRRRNNGEADRLLTVYSKQFGKIQIKAIGVRRITSRRSSHSELLNQCRLTLYKGRGMPLLTEIETLNNFSSIKDNLTKVGFAYHICELIEGLCPENQENKQVFFLLQKTLTRLSQEEDILAIIHEFEISLLTSLGFWPTKTHRIKEEQLYIFIENILEKKLKAKRIVSRL